ncbi:glutathione S-transferase D1-like isoform X1 [Lutzomyia longipalpis]|uniref:glutathione S-transferase D1-like isoform X1 n=1 Tax=Lutzomyia longipalpis TaxID=7200 RepID=UPI002483633B|nr:glutathione S-transferase D1-like isoform X1 [Lutzomyia longipalpis]XP_055679025.1 glutathione S-transferase D1-like isoform X1 [Lutzomyia longipalpis]XP_055679026.1 glutathione S-transferase D1-like isoform X1 [Lutzomyia longipalpis]XP_055679027.1 glutathione S-transferase D1-like isoform X1 [Lutzomyia longipalpis]
MPIDLYYSPISAHCRSVLLLNQILGIEFNLKEIYSDNRRNQMLQKKSEFRKINNQEILPTIVDDGFTLWGCREILQYLVEKYGKDDSLYPKDPQKRALVNQKLYFDMGTLHQPFADYYFKRIFAKTSIDPAAFKKIEEAMGFFNTGLEGQLFAAGDALTIADFSLMATVSTYDAFKFDLTPYPNVAQWFERSKKTMPGYEEINQKSSEMEEYHEKILSRLQK